MMTTPAPFPASRLRRLRRTPWVRSMVAETHLLPCHLIQPLFVHDESGNAPISSLPGMERLSVDALIRKAAECRDAGIPAIALFPVTPPLCKTARGEEAASPDNLMCRAIRALKAAVPDIGIIGDVALDPYTTHGHDGVLDAAGQVDNDATVAVLCRQALVLAEAGCDILAPSDMMDGRIAAIRSALEQAGHSHTILLSYAAKYASRFYGAFRDAVGSTQTTPPDKRGYQMNPAGGHREALREVAQDVAEGADMVMVKPGLPYLDIIHAVRQDAGVPVLAYQVSGEYAMLWHGAQAGAFDWHQAMTESLLCLRRAGADAIITYAALEMARRAIDGTGAAR